jgi:hypothetical protein
MPALPKAPAQFQYAIIRVVPRVERGESFNAGVVLMSRPLRFLGARTTLDDRRLEALAPGLDPSDIRAHLAMIERIASGDPTGGPIAALPAAQRFHWLVAPSSTIIQPSAVHTGLSADARAELDHLFESLVG